MKLSLSVTHPEHAMTWHPTKNGNLLPSEVSPHSRNKAWWLCPETGGEWEQQVNIRARTALSSPFVRNIFLLKGYNDLGTKRPDLIAEWHPTKNGDLTISDVRFNSTKNVWWLDPATGGEWEASPKTRNSGQGRSPFAKGQKLLIGHNDLASHVPGVEKYWSSQNELLPCDILAQSNRTIILEAPDGSDLWEDTPYRVTKRYASLGQIDRVKLNARIIVGRNDLATTHPDVASTWHPTKNGDLTSSEVTVGTTRSVWWLCPISGGEWESPPATRVRLKEISPFVGGKVLLVGFNDLATTHPNLITEWHPILNKGYMPQDFLAGSAFQAWWQCSKTGQVWNAPIYNRTRGGSGTPSGSPYITSSQSRGEKDLLAYLSKILPGQTIIERDRKLLHPFEIDLYIPSQNLGIEYNGLYWHSELRKKPNYHQRKQEIARQAGITLITVWEDDWELRQEIAKRMLAHKLNATPKTSTVGARKTSLKEVDADTARRFAEQNHLQGYKAGYRYTALQHQEETVALAIWSKHGKTLYLDRYCTSKTVPGGFTKLLKESRLWASQNNITEIVTFADLLVSDGELYKKNGFEEESTLRPDYCYFYQGQRVHKFNFRKTRFKKDPNLLWEDGLTEKELASLNNLPRIWDAGKKRYVMKIEESCESS